MENESSTWSANFTSILHPVLRTSKQGNIFVLVMGKDFRNGGPDTLGTSVSHSMGYHGGVGPPSTLYRGAIPITSEAP